MTPMPIVQLSELAHSLQNRFRQAKFLQVLIHQSNILMASERLLATLERILGGQLQNFLHIYHVGYYKYIL